VQTFYRYSSGDLPESWGRLHLECRVHSERAAQHPDQLCGCDIKFAAREAAETTPMGAGCMSVSTSRMASFASWS